MPIPESTITEKRYAVSIGINQYQTSAGLSTLQFAESDAQAIDTLFGDLGIEAENRCLLLGEAATLEAVNQALSTTILDKPGKNDLVIFYFAGHSLPLTINDDEVKQGGEPRSEVFLATYDFDRQLIKGLPSFRKQHALGMERLRKDFFEGEEGARKRLFLFDSCYSGDFYGPRYRDEADPVRGYIKHTLDSKSAGRVALSSCLPIQKALEDPKLGHGRFTYHVLEALSGRAADALRRDGCITVNSLFEYLTQQLPNDQRPVLSGVQQDSFKLVCYEDRDVSIRSTVVSSEDTRQVEKEVRLRAMLADHRSFMNDRLASFVGRQAELAEIHHRIAEKLPSGGYVTITAQAGQGKSCIIAKLIQEYGPENVAFHFIPFNPGPDHQVGLLRNIMARLILKYNLSDLYVAGERRATLRDFLPRVLEEVEAKGGREVIFIDGLDQLQEDYDGIRDLSFLPNNPPAGVVFVLGTRPNDTLRPLELLKPYHEYHLPSLSREDFDLILRHRQVTLEKALTDQFYEAMQKNALYLDLVAKELREREAISPQEVIARIAYNPENLFSLSIDRLKRQPTEWREVIKPILGLLLVAREPLSINHIKRILKVDHDRIWDGITRLGGLLTEGEQHHYSLFHLKLQDYLRQDMRQLQKQYVFATDEEEEWHARMAKWCEGEELALIWNKAKDLVEQDRRKYAQRHYLTHLFLAKQWNHLFKVVDEGSYGQAKVRADPSTRSYALDLDLARQAAALDGWTMKEGLEHLPHLWRYTLLRCSLASLADKYPDEAFELLLLLNRVSDALGLAELLTDAFRRAHVLLLIASYLITQPGRESEGVQICMQIYKIAPATRESKSKARAWGELRGKLRKVLIQAQQWDLVNDLTEFTRGSRWRAEAWRELGSAKAQAQQWKHAQQAWQEAKQVIGDIEDDEERAEAQRDLGSALAQAQQWEQAEQIIRTIGVDYWRAVAWSELGHTLAQAQQWEHAQQAWQEAKQVTSEIRVKYWRAVAWSELGHALAQAQQWEHAQQAWQEAQQAASDIEDDEARAEVQRDLGRALAQAQQWKSAEQIIRTIGVKYWRAVAWSELGHALAQAQQWEHAQQAWQEAQSVIGSIGSTDRRASAIGILGRALAQAQQWKSAEQIIRTIGVKYWRAVAWSELGRALTEAQQWEHARQAWQLAQQAASDIEDDEVRLEAWMLLEVFLIKAQQWEQAEQVIWFIQDGEARIKAWMKLGIVLAEAQQWEKARRMWKNAEEVLRAILDNQVRSKLWSQLGAVLMRAQQWEHAQQVIRVIQDDEIRLGAWKDLGSALAEVQQWEQAHQALQEAQKVIQDINDDEKKARAWSELESALIQAQQWDRAEEVIQYFKENQARAKAWMELGNFLTQAQQRDRSQRVWKRAKSEVHAIKDKQVRAKTWIELGNFLTQAQQFDQAELAWKETEQAIQDLTDNEARNTLWRELGSALLQAQQFDQAEQAWERSEKEIHTIWSGNKRAEARMDLLNTLLKAHQWERAERVISAIEDDEEVLMSWEVSESLQIDANRLERIQDIEDDVERSEAARMLFSTLAETQQWEQAYQAGQEGLPIVQYGRPYQSRTIVRRVHYEKVMAWRELGSALAEAQQWERAHQAWDEAQKAIQDIKYDQKAKAWQELGSALAEAQQWERAHQAWDEAQKVIQDIQDIQYDEEKAKGWSELASTLIQAQHGEQVEEQIRIVENSNEKVKAWRELASTLIQARQWEQAEQVIQTIKDIQTKAKAWRELGSALAEAQQWEHARQALQEAQKVIQDIRDDEKVKAWRELASTLIQARQWEQAEQVIQTIKDIQTKADAWRELGNAFAQALQWEHAEHLIQGIEDNQIKAKAWRELGSALAQARQLEQVKRLILTIRNSNSRTKIWRELASALVRAKQWDQVDEVIRAIESHIEKFKALSEVIEALLKANEYERLLYFLQYSWLLASTREYALQSLSLAHGLIPLKPELGTAFIESFAWVDGFLKA